MFYSSQSAPVRSHLASLARVRLSLCVTRGLGPAHPPKATLAASPRVNGFTIRVQVNCLPAMLQGGKRASFCSPVWRDRQQMSTAKNTALSCVWWGAEKEGLREDGSHSQMLWILSALCWECEK